MINLVGDLPDVTAMLRVEGAHLHIYGKTPRSGRMLGHVTVTAASRDELAARMRRVEEQVKNKL
jgi:5-(carboxyamino)imidazole ribonucleotide synthase